VWVSCLDELHALGVKNARRREGAACSVFFDDLRDALVAEPDDPADLAQRDARSDGLADRGVAL
jgi:hypothetical protein